MATAAADPPLDPPAEREIVRVVHRAERRLLARRAQRELVEIRFADDDRAGFAKSRDHRRIARGDVLASNVRRGGRGLAGDVDQVLDRDRNAVHRAAVYAAPLFVVRGLRGSTCAGFVDEDEGVGAAAMFGDRGEAGFNELRRRRHRE